MTFATITKPSRFQATKAAAAAASKPAAKKGDWRKKREEFIAALRAAKERKKERETMTFVRNVKKLRKLSQKIANCGTNTSFMG